MKRYALLLTAALGMAAAQTTTPTPGTATPRTADVQLSTANVTVEIGRYGGPLSSLLGALAKAAGYGLILDANVDGLSGTAATATPTAPDGTPTTGNAPADSARPIVYSFQNKPFNEVWPLLMDVYGLSYEVVRLGGQPVLRVSNTPIQRVVPLRNADAAQASTQVKLFFGTPTYNETPQRDAQGNTTGVTRTLVDVKLDSPTLRVVPDIRSNSVIVRGTNKEVAEVERLLAQLDSTGNASGAASTPGTAAQTVQRVYTVKGQQADITALLGAQYPGLKVTTVGQTGQLVITGPQNQLDAALTLLAQVDRPAPPPQAGPQTVQKVFQLVNASAEEVKATLEGTLARDLTPASGNPQKLANVPVNATDANGNAITVTVPTTGTSAAQNASQTTQNSDQNAQTTNGATIIADKRTNTLIVRGTPEQVAQVAELVPQLDQVVPQINVQVRIQEINETAARTLGLDWKVNIGGFNISVGGGGLGAAFDPTRNLMGFNIFPTLQALENQGLTKRVYDGNITMQSGQRSLGTGTSTQNASANAAASIKSGGRLEINIPSSAGNIEKQIDYGLNLDFFDPQVAPDGTVTLRVRGQLSNIPGGLSPNALPNLLNFTNSEAQSTITFKSGQTVLMSGLLGTSESRSNDGVPFLSSLPVVGAAFGKQTTRREQSQLLVIITGNVVK